MLSSESSNPTKKPPPSPRKKKIIIGRLPSRYHLFCVQEVKRLNDALPKGQKRLLIGDPDGVRALRERWMAMSEEERVSATETAYQEAVARIKAHSGKTTRQIGNIQWLLEGLKEYKELEYALVILRRSEKEPMVFQSSHYVEGFWKEKFQSSLQDIAKAMQIHTYKAKGMRPLAKDMSIEHIRELLAKFSNDPKDTIRDVNGVPLDYAFMPDVYDVQRATHELMSQKLREATRRPGTRPMRVQYRIFDEAITKRYGVTIEGWPAVRFGNTFSNVRDSLTLYLAWRSGEARFRKLTSVEKKLWDMTRERLKEERVGSYTSEEIEAARQIHLYWIEYDNNVIGTIGQIAMFMDAPFATLRKWRESGDPRGFGCRPKMGGKGQDKLDTLSPGGIALPAHSR